jgi:hypothetical protein
MPALCRRVFNSGRNQGYDAFAKLRRGYITLNATKKAQSIALCAFYGN